MKKVSKEKSINPIAWVPTEYFAMGLPFIAVNLVSTFMFKDLGISDTQIAFWTSVIMLPWTLKFLWSPFLEMYRTKKFFVLITELLSGVLFGYRHPVTEWIIIRYSSSLIELRLFFRYQYLHDGRHRFEWSHARHSL